MHEKNFTGSPTFFQTRSFSLEPSRETAEAGLVVVVVVGDGRVRARAQARAVEEKGQRQLKKQSQWLEPNTSFLRRHDDDDDDTDDDGNDDNNNDGGNDNSDNNIDSLDSRLLLPRPKRET